jgi:hypothetical protein
MALDIGKGDRTSWASRIRGEERIALVDDLARGDRTHAQLAEEYGRSPDAIHQFASRNSAEIARRRAVLQGELGAETAEKSIRYKAQLVDLYQKHYEDLEAALSDPALSDNVRLRYIREADALLHRVSELMGWLPSRTQVQLDMGGVEFPPLGTKWVQVAVDGSGADS